MKNISRKLALFCKIYVYDSKMKKSLKEIQRNSIVKKLLRHNGDAKHLKIASTNQSSCEKIARAMINKSTTKLGEY